MLPNSAIPSAPPSSAPVSESPAAAPARSAGALPMMRSFVSVNSGAAPSEKTTEPVAIIAKPEAVSNCVKTATPRAANSSPVHMTVAGGNRRAIGGVSWDPTTNASAQGSIHRPASSGARPSTSWRYWGMNRIPPNTNMIPSA